MLAVSDVIAVLFGSLFFGFLGGNNVNALFWSVALAPFWLLLAKLLGLYDRDRRSIRHLTVDEMPLLAGWALSAALGVMLFLRFVGPTHLSVADGARFGFVAFVSATVLRSLSRRLWRGITPVERAAIIGSSRLAKEIRTKMRLFPDVHTDIVALFTKLDTQADLEDNDPWRSIDRIIITENVGEARLNELTALRPGERIEVGFVPPDCSPFSKRIHHHDRDPDVSVVEYRTLKVTRTTLLLKRAFDIIVGSALLILFAPFAVMIALAIMIDSRGSAIYSQCRAGLRSKPFRMYKFRTMVRDAERQLEELVSIDSLSEPVFKLQDDPRVTRVGRFLRRWSLDELPQLINVVTGHMSLVGHRPEQVEIVERYTEAQRIRLQVRPGLTGPMQVYGRGELNFDERLAVERDYIENLSLRRDLHILRMTIPAIIGGRGAF